MIKSRDDYVAYRIQDGTWKRDFKTFMFNDIERFKVILRKAEFYTNCSSTLFGRCLGYGYRFMLNRFGRKLGFSIPVNAFGPGLSIPHWGTIVVNPAARVGKNCRLHVCVNIGATGGSNKAPKIGDNVYIAPGVKIFGEIEIADDVALAANAVVNRSVTQKGVTVGGVPAKIIGEGGRVAAGWLPEKNREES